MLRTMDPSVQSDTSELPVPKKHPLLQRFTSFWTKISSHKNISLLGVILLAAVAIGTPLYIAQQQNTKSHAGLSLYNCIPIPTGLNQQQVHQLLQSGKVNWCSSLGASTQQNGIHEIEIVTAYGKYWKFDLNNGGQQIGTGGTDLTTIPRYATGPCAGKQAGGCMLDTQTIFTNGNGIQDESDTAYGKYWGYDYLTGNPYPNANSNNGDLAKVARYMNGPCSGKTSLTCKFDTYAVFTAGNGHQIESITAYGKFWGFDITNGATMNAGSGGDLTSAARFATGPCVGKSVGQCSFDTYAVYTDITTGDQIEYITAYGKYWKFDITKNYQPDPGNGSDLTTIPYLATGPCAGKAIGTCKLNTHTFFIDSNSFFANAPITEYGPIVYHGMTFDDYWSNMAVTPWIPESNRPPTDGSIKTLSFYPNGDQIVTKGDSYWLLKAGQMAWSGPLSLHAKWASCSNFPTNGIDAYSIYPGTTPITQGYEFAFSGTKLFTLDQNGKCVINGPNWAPQQASFASPNGNYPLKNNTHIDQFQWLDANTQMYFTGNQEWLVGANNNTIGCVTPSAKAWHFCEPETLSQVWIQLGHSENHPPTDKIGVFATRYLSSVDTTKNPRVFTYGNHVWTLGENGFWSSFQSGPDGYGGREAFLLSDTDTSGNTTYYLYYDAAAGMHQWGTMVATAKSPQGPWQKRGIIQMTGTVRPWETTFSAASTVFKVNGKYYNFYIGANLYSFPNSNTPPGSYYLPTSANYFYLGIAVADSPLGPFRRIKTDGSLRADGQPADSTTSDSYLIPIAQAGQSYRTPNTSVTGQGGLVKINNTWYYTVSAASNNPAITNPANGETFAPGMIQAQNVNGPWTDVPLNGINPIISTSQRLENPALVFDPVSHMYLVVGNAVYADQIPIWSSLSTQCEKQYDWGLGVGTILYWSPDLFHWSYDASKKVLAAGDPNLACGGDETFNPLNPPTGHRGSVGLGAPLIVQNERKLYVAFDANSFQEYYDPNLGNAQNITKDQMFRDIYLLSLPLP